MQPRVYFWISSPRGKEKKNIRMWVGQTFRQEITYIHFTLTVAKHPSFLLNSYCNHIKEYSHACFSRSIILVEKALKYCWRAQLPAIIYKLDIFVKLWMINMEKAWKLCSDRKDTSWLTTKQKFILSFPGIWKRQSELHIIKWEDSFQKLWVIFHNFKNSLKNP